MGIHRCRDIHHSTVQVYLDGLLHRIPHLYGVLVTDKDGVALVRAMGDELKDAQLDPALSAAFTAAAEQCGKLGLGSHVSLTCAYDNYTLVQINLLPLVVTLLAAPDANVQLIHNCRGEMARLLEPVRISVQQTVMQAANQEA